MSRAPLLLAPLAAVVMAATAGLATAQQRGLESEVGLAVAASSASAATTPADGLDDRAVLNPLAEIGIDSLTGFRDRPLFTPNRRPPAPPPPEPEPEPVATVDEPDVEPVEPEVGTPMVVLAGILEADTDRVALLRDMNTSTTISVRVGDPVEDWTVAAIGGDSVTLEHEGEQHQIKIFQPGGDGPDGGGPPPAADPELVDPAQDDPDFEGAAGARRPPGAHAAMPRQPASEDQIVDPGDPAAIDENGDSADDPDYEGDSAFDAATDGDVPDAAEGLDPSGSMDSGDDFGEDRDGDGVPDADQNPDGG